MRVLVVFAHPDPESFGHAVYRCLVDALATAGHEVRPLDLYRIGFDPVLNAERRRDYHIPEVNETHVADHFDHIRWAEGLILVYPTWWYSQPATLKGWIDRVWVPFATFELPQGLQPIRGRMHNIRLIGEISTYGSPWWWVRVVMRGIRPLCHPRCRAFWLGHYRMDSSTQASRSAFLERVRRHAARV
jgi:putative NADPH-quinone reductase